MCVPEAVRVCVCVSAVGPVSLDVCFCIDGGKVTVWSVNSVRGYSAVQWTESSGLGIRSLGSSPSAGTLPGVFNKPLAFSRLQFPQL